jgi:hypothetical protein
MRTVIKIISAVFACAFVLDASAQTTEKDSLGDYMIVNPTKYTPTITEAFKINDNPVVIDSTKRIPALNYSISSRKEKTTFEVDTIAAAKMEGEKLDKLYRSLVKVGMGNYTTPYGELFYNNLRSKEYNYGVHLKHISSSATLADKGFAGYSDNQAELYGKKFLKKHTLWGDAGYYRNVVHNYGYDTSLFHLDSDVTYERYNLISGRAGLQSHLTDSSNINHDLSIGLYSFSDFYKSSEINFKAQGLFSGYYEKQLVKLLAGVDFYNNKTLGDTANNTILFINPSILAKGDKWRAGLGIDARIDIADENKFFFYPSVDFSYDPFDHILIPYAGITGGLDKNSYRGLAEENPFVQPGVPLRNSNRKFEVFGGLKGSISSNSSYNARFSYANVINMPFFVNDTTYNLERNRFTVVYDSVKVMNLHGELLIQHSEKLKLIMKGDYNSYKTTHELRAWHRPELELTLSANYNLQDKIIVRADVFAISKQYARVGHYDALLNKSTVAAKELKGIADVNLGVEYRYTKILSAWINFNNIGATRYYRWNNYPLQRFNVMGGLTFAF